MVSCRYRLSSTSSELKARTVRMLAMASWAMELAVPMKVKISRFSLCEKTAYLPREGRGKKNKGRMSQTTAKGAKG